MKNLSRRDALKRGGAAAVAGSILAILPAAAKPEPDAELLRLGAEWRQARKEVAQASAEMDALEKRSPARPGPSHRIRARNGGVLTEPEIREQSCWPRRRMEQDIALLRVYEAESAAWKAARKRLGIPAADMRLGAAFDRAWTIEDEIIAAPAHTLAGLAIKLRVAEKDIRNGGDPESAMMQAIVEDGLRLAGGAA